MKYSSLLRKLKSITTIFLATILLNLQLFAYGTPINVNPEAVDQSAYIDDSDAILMQVCELDALSEYVDNNPNASYDEIATSSPNLVTDVSSSSNATGSQSGPPLGIPSFLWGCLFGLLGVILVYVSTDNKAEGKKAMSGCIGASILLLPLCILVASSGNITVSITGN